MNKTLVTFFSRTGNTRRVAEAIFEALDGEKDILPLDEVQSLDPYTLVFIGFPVQSHSLPYKVEAFLKNVKPGKKIALFCTFGALPGHRLSREALEYAVVLATKAQILGTFCVRGKLSLQALEVLSRSPEHQEWVEMAPSASTHPDEGDLEEACAFARQVKTRSAHGPY
jgi:flavodoxin